MTKRAPSVNTKAERLLSGGRGPSVQEQDAMLARILADVPKPASEGAADRSNGRAGWQRFFRPLASLAGLGALASVVLLFVIADPVAPDEVGSFGVRGEGGADAVAVHVGCGDTAQRVGAAWTTTPLVCAHTDALVLRAVRTEADWSVAAALFADDQSLTWIWPQAGDDAIATRPAGSDNVAVSLEHMSAPGARLLVRITRGKQTRTAARERFAAYLAGGASNNSDNVADTVLEATVRLGGDAPAVPGRTR